MQRGLGGARQRVERALAEAKARYRSPPPSSSGAAPKGTARQRISRGEVAIAPPAVQDEPGQEALDVREHVVSLFLKNDFSGKSAAELVKKAHRAGVRGVKDISSAGSSGRHPGNASRYLLRVLLRECKMPALYHADIPL